MARTVAAVLAELHQLAQDFPTLCTEGTDFAQSSHRGHPLRYLRIASPAAGERQAVLITAGLHAREWVPPDAVLDFARRLLTAYSTPGATIDLPALTGSTAISYARATATGPVPDTLDLPATSINRPRIVDAMDRLEIYLAPLVNPDGREYTMGPVATASSGFDSSMWRKNDPPPDGDDPTSVATGVNLNANFPVPASGPTTGTLWGDLERYYAPAAALGTHLGAGGVLASNDPADLLLYVGPTAGSEPETAFVMWLVETKRIRFFMDIHTSAHLISYPWAMERDGDDQTMVFSAAKWDSRPETSSTSHEPPISGLPGRDGTMGDKYSEYMPYDLAFTHLTTARNIRDDILRAAGVDAAAIAQSTYNDRTPSARRGSPLGSIAEILYAAPASGMDWVFSRQLTDPSLAPIFAFALEAGADNEGDFQPNYATQYPKHDREITIAIMRLFTFAAQWSPLPAPTPTPERSWRSRWCPCTIATAAYGTPWHPRLVYIRRVRDQELRTTRLGRALLWAVEGVYHRLSPPVARFIAPRPRARAITRRCAVAPVYGAIRACDRLASPIGARAWRVRALVALFSLLALTGLAAAALAAWWLAALAALAARAGAAWVGG